MQNYFTIETEVAFRRAEWERMVTAATRAAQAPPQSARWDWSLLPHQLLAGLRALVTPRVPVTCSWRIAAETCATTLNERHLTVT